jgi:hypothetical protein
MSRLFGNMRQVGIVVRDIEDRNHTERLSNSARTRERSRSRNL